MSFNVLVIPEDFTKDEHILKPLIDRIMRDCGRKAQVQVCRNPNFQGVQAALNISALREVIALYPMVNLFILVVDRDGNAGRKQRTDQIESTLSIELLPQARRFLAEVAWQEVEVFILAGLSLPADWRWNEIRADANVKDTYFKQLVVLRQTLKYPHEGRKKLMAESISNWQRIKSRCPEDVVALIARASSGN
ncbi:MAG: hypothetical protein AABO41_24480 [Acidobacteriota bacterium]